MEGAVRFFSVSCAMVDVARDALVTRDDGSTCRACEAHPDDIVCLPTGAHAMRDEADYRRSRADRIVPSVRTRQMQCGSGTATVRLDRARGVVSVELRVIVRARQGCDADDVHAMLLASVPGARFAPGGVLVGREALDDARGVAAAYLGRCGFAPMCVWQ